MLKLSTSDFIFRPIKGQYFTTSQQLRVTGPPVKLN